MQRRAWIWLVGAVAWAVDGSISMARHSAAHATLAFLVATLFLIAWLFYRGQKS